MHRSLRERLEDLLATRTGGTVSASVGEACACTECSTEFGAMHVQSQMLKSMRPPSDLEPSAGFYARVMQRIEESARRSIWWVFVYSPVGKRLAYGSLSVAVALASYMIAAEGFDDHLNEPVAVAQSNHVDAIVAGTPESQREAVLVNFMTHPQPLQ